MLGVGVGLALAVLLLYCVDPASAGLYPACPLHLLTGLQCPGCGSLRGLHHLLHGEVRAALGYNVLLIVTLPLLAWMLGAWAMRRPAVVPRPLGIALLLAALGFAIVRNVPEESRARWALPEASVGFESSRADSLPAP